MENQNYSPSNTVTKTVNVAKAGTNIKVDVLKSNAINTTLKVAVKSG